MIQQSNGKFEMPALPYAAGDLAPVLSQETIEFHYGKHLQTYLNNLNAALPGSAFEGKTVEEIVKTAEGGVFNNAGQFLNHYMYFMQFKAPSAGNVPTFRLGLALCRRFGQARHHARRQRPEPAHQGSQAAADLRRVGTCLLHRLPQPPSGLPQGSVADCGLGRGQQPSRLISKQV